MFARERPIKVCFQEGAGCYVITPGFEVPGVSGLAAALATSSEGEVYFVVHTPSGFGLISYPFDRKLALWVIRWLGKRVRRGVRWDKPFSELWKPPMNAGKILSALEDELVYRERLGWSWWRILLFRPWLGPSRHRRF